MRSSARRALAEHRHRRRFVHAVLRCGRCRAASAALPRRTPAHAPRRRAESLARICSFGRCAVPNGRSTKNAVPLPTSLSRAQRSAVLFDEFLDQRQADAAAFEAAAARVLDAVKALEQPRHFRFGYAGAGVPHDEFGAAVALAQRHADLAFEGELECVREQVQHDLFPHVAIDEDRLRQRWAIDDEIESGLLRRRTEIAGEFRGETAQDRWAGTTPARGRLRCARNRAAS